MQVTTAVQWATFTVWLVLASFAAEPVAAQSNKDTFASADRNAVDAVRDLHCVRFKASDSRTFSEATGHANSLKINDWFDAVYPSWPVYPDYNTLTFDAGYVCLADTIGMKDGAQYTASSSSGLLLTAVGDDPINPKVRYGYFPNLAKVRVQPSSGGTLPAGLKENTDYWTIYVSNSQIKLASSYASAQAGKAIRYTNSGSGAIIVYQRSLPSNFNLIVGGGWANTRYSPHHYFNVFSSGIIWVGDPREPVLRLSGYGNIVKCNVYSHPFIGNPEPTTRSKCAILMVHSPDSRGSATGKHDISLHCEGFDAAVKVENVQSGHSDCTTFTRLETRNCLSMIDCDNNQSIGHHVVTARFYCPEENVHTSLFKFRRGSNLSVDNLSVIGDYGTTILDIPATAIGGDNGGSYKFDYFMVDRALVVRTKESTDPNNCLRLIDLQSRTSAWIRMAGHIAHANEDLSTNWYNVRTDEPIVVTTTPAPGQVHDIKLDVSGLDNATAKAFQ